MECEPPSGGRQLALLEFPTMQPVAMTEVEAQLRLEASVSGLADRVPLVSARSLVSRGQRRFLIGLLARAGDRLGARCHLTATVVIAWCTLNYLIAVSYRAYLFTRSSKSDALEIVTDEEALTVPDSELALLHDHDPRIQRTLCHHQADREPGANGLPDGSPRSSPPDRGGRRGNDAGVTDR